MALALKQAHSINASATSNFVGIDFFLSGSPSSTLHLFFVGMRSVVSASESSGRVFVEGWPTSSETFEAASWGNVGQFTVTPRNMDMSFGSAGLYVPIDMAGATLTHVLGPASAEPARRIGLSAIIPAAINGLSLFVMYDFGAPDNPEFSGVAQYSPFEFALEDV